MGLFGIAAKMVFMFIGWDSGVKKIQSGVKLLKFKYSAISRVHKHGRFDGGIHGDFAQFLDRSHGQNVRK